VGDPITLNVELSGPAYLDHVALPPLTGQPALARDFRIPEEMAEGKVAGGHKVFTQTLRALRSDVTEIPAIELPYFDTESGAYRTARSEPIPLKVSEARIVTAADAEGVEPPPAAGGSLEAWTRGIAHNYEDAGLLVDQSRGPDAWVRSTFWVAFLAAPPGAYVVLLTGAIWVRRRRSDPSAARRRRAFSRAARVLRRADGSEERILDALRQYFSDKFSFPGAAVTVADVRDRLTARGLDDETTRRVEQLFETCEAGRYAGHALSGTDRAALAGDALKLLGLVERGLK
jgi:hypothetical protein